MKFKMIHKDFPQVLEEFADTDAPDWLTSAKTVAGSTMDSRWFWTKHVLTLSVGQSVETEFRVITRTA